MEGSGRDLFKISWRDWVHGKSLTIEDLQDKLWTHNPMNTKQIANHLAATFHVYFNTHYEHNIGQLLHHAHLICFH
jgi:hypothetical protein